MLSDKLRTNTDKIFTVQEARRVVDKKKKKLTKLPLSFFLIAALKLPYLIFYARVSI